MLPARFQRRICIGVVIVLAGLPTIPSSGEVASRAALAGFDFSGVRAGDVAQRRVAVANPGDRPIAIKSVNTSCSCTRVLGFTRSVPTSGEGTVLLEFRPPKPGYFDIEVLIETDREKDAVVALHWAGDVAAADKNQPALAAAPDAGILVSPQDASAARKDADALLVDVREPADFNLCHVDGSTNWPVRVLKGISSLKGKKLVLIGKGSDDEALVREALALRAAGFEAPQVLQGGVRAWTQMRLPLGGSGIGTVRPASVAPLEFFATRQDEWLVIEVTSGGSGFRAGIPGANYLTLGSDWEGELSRILNTETERRSAPFRVLVASEAGEHYENIERSLPANLPAPVFFLEGGLRAYRDFAKGNAALLNRREMKLSTTQGAGRDFNNTAIHDTTGCASCPKKKSAQ